MLLGESSYLSSLNDPPVLSKGHLKSAAMKWILKHWENHRIPHSVMESIVSGAASLMQIALDGIQSQIERRLKEADVSSDVVSSVCALLSDKTQYTNVFQGLETTYRQNEYIKTNFQFVVS